MLQDLRFAVRLLRKQPGFSLVAILTLAIGIGATAAVFSMIQGVRAAAADRARENNRRLPSCLRATRCPRRVPGN
jgi:predicted lysophospholipase L1 biosynthesis ABC-type transport system permease subunit